MNEAVAAGNIEQIQSEIAALTEVKDLVSVAIAGPPGSGKSTLAEQLAAYFGPCCCIIPMDGFHFDNDVLQQRGLLAVKGSPETFDRDGFAELIRCLSQRQISDFPTFDRAADKVISRGGSVSEETSVLIFEGNYLLFDEPGWSDLAAQWDAAVWLDVPEAVLETRLTERWLTYGMTQEQATKRAQANDMINARRIQQKALPATWVLRI